MPATSWPGGCACSGRASTAAPRRGTASPGSSTASAPGPASSARSLPDMAELVFDCTGAEPDRYAVVPSMNLKLRISETSGDRIEAIARRCQIRIEPARRRYTPAEEERLNDLFGDTSRWADTLKPL